MLLSVLKEQAEAITLCVHMFWRIIWVGVERQTNDWVEVVSFTRSYSGSQIEHMPTRKIFFSTEYNFLSLFLLLL